MFMHMEHITKESFSSTENIVAALGMVNDFSAHTILLCGEFQLMQCGGLEICGGGGDSVEILTTTSELEIASAGEIGILGKAQVF